jgi:serine/threonine protein kinase/Flp pilus assembly protein TadD
MIAQPKTSSTGRSAELAAILEQLASRIQAGESIDVDAVARDHPEHADQLRGLLPAMALLANFSKSDAPLDPRSCELGALGDFQLVREIGRGGMGVVYEALQLSLNRSVALKVLPFAATMDPRQLQRFKHEAQAAAILHHPHIVPVFGVGCERGVHYYAMQLIDGRSMAAVVEELKPSSATKVQEQPVGGTADRDPTPSHAHTPTLDTTPVASLTFQKSKSKKDKAYYRSTVEHIAQAADALEYAHSMGVVHRDIKPANLLLDDAGHLWVTDFGLAKLDTAANLTVSNDLIGTLRYMSPEQALARHGLVDHRTDVYSLGATLYELLTLRPVFDGKDKHEILKQIAFEEPVTLRKIDRTIPAELETIALKALAKAPAERYATAGVLADDLRRFLLDEPIRARRPTLRRRLERWARRHRPLVAVAAALAMVALALGGAGLLWLQRQRAAVDGDLKEAELWQKREHWPEALQALERATGRLAWVGWDSRRDQVEQRRREVALVARLEDARLQTAAAAGTGFDYAGQDRAYGLAFAEHDLDVSGVAPEEAAKQIRASTIRVYLIAALDEWAFVKERLQVGSGEPLLMVAQLADDDPWRQRLRDPDVCRDRSALERLANDASLLAQPPANLVLLAGALSNVQGQATAVAMLRKAQQRHPADFWVNFELAFLLDHEGGMGSEAVPYARAALALRPNSTAVYNNLGVTLYHQEKREEAEAAYRKAIELHPGNASAHANLGIILDDQGLLPQAVAEYQKAIEIIPDFAVAHCNLGITLRKQNQTNDAITELRTAISLNPKYVGAHIELGLALLDKKLPDEAMEEYRKAIKLEPTNAVAHLNLGNSFKTNRQTDRAIQEFRTAIKLDPKLATAYLNLGTTLGAGREDEGIPAFRKAVELDSKSAVAHHRLGIALASKKLLDEAILEFQLAIDLDPKLGAAHGTLGLALLDLGQFSDARQESQKALDLLVQTDPVYPVALRLQQRCDGLIARETKLAQVLSGQAEPVNANECLDFAWLCQRNYKQFYFAAFRFFEQAFTDQPALADNMQRQSRYDAACAAALAGCGMGKDAGALGEETRKRLRQQALKWLQTDLIAWGKLLDNDPDKARPRVAQVMRDWQSDVDFVGVRGPEALCRLPEAERPEWQKLWVDVAILRQRADTPKAAPDPRPGR